MKKAVLLIPAYKPSIKLTSLLNSIVKFDNRNLFQKIVILNDGSGPEFAEIFSKIKKIDSVCVVEHAVNLGKGAALKTGFNHILVHYPDILSIVTADDDGQHAPEDIIKVALTANQSPGVLVLGVRKFEKDIPLKSLIGNTVTRYIFRLFTGLKLSDTQTGLRAWPIYLCLQGLNISASGYNFEMESLVRANELSKRKLEFIEVPIRTIYEDENASTHFNPILDSMRIYFVFMRYSGSSIIAALIDNAVFAIIYPLTQSIAWSQFYGRFTAMVVAFVLLRQIVFKSHAKWLVSLLKYVTLVVVFGYFSYAAIIFMHFTFGMSIILSKIFAEAILFVAGFAVLRSYIFK